jgi:hypothetical protein
MINFNDLLLPLSLNSWMINFHALINTINLWFQAKAVINAYILNIFPIFARQKQLGYSNTKHKQTRMFFFSNCDPLLKHLKHFFSCRIKYYDLDVQTSAARPITLCFNMYTYLCTHIYKFKKLRLIIIGNRNTCWGELNGKSHHFLHKLPSN